MTKPKKSFVFLQGPHGPFFAQLAKMLTETHADVLRVCFNAGDERFWPKSLPSVQFKLDVVEWSAYFQTLVKEHSVTDLVLYGDTRAIHAEAIAIAKKKNITIHVFEEGYLRPYWVTYERDGVNGNSALMNMSMDDVIKRRAKRQVDLQATPAQWGSLWHHNWYGFAYHFALATGARKYPNYKPHRNISIWEEVKLNAIRLLMMPYHIVQRDITTRKFIKSGSPFFVAMLQLEHDASLKYHSDYQSQEQFINELIENFVFHAPSHYRLVFKMHPLDDQRAPIRQWINDACKTFDAENRVYCIHGGKLGAFMNRAKAAIAINSTSVQQAMWRGIPVKLFGRSVFGKLDFTSDQSLQEFFKTPDAPDKERFLEYRSYLLETSQIGGGYYTQTGRAEVLRNAVDMVLAKTHPYEL